MKEGEFVVVSDEDKFKLYSYKSEKELEDFAVKFTKEMFGLNTLYLNAKRKITSNKGTSAIPDGLLLDLGNEKFYIVEIELSAHDIISHISNQLMRFKLAMNNKETCEQISRNFYDKIARDAIKSDISLDKIQRIINKQFGIIVIIDSISEKLQEIFELHESDRTEVLVVPFETYIDSKNSYIHRFNTFTKEALEKEARKWTFKWGTVPIEKHLGKTDKNVKEIFSILRKEICSLPNVEEKSRKGWVTYQTSPLKNFCTVKILPDCLEVHIKCNNSFKDDKGITRKIQRTASWTFDRVFFIKSDKDMVGASNFIKQSYYCTCLNSQMKGGK